MLTDTDSIIPCSRCPTARVCLPSSVPDANAALVESMVVRQQTLQAGQTLFRQGAEFVSLFAVRSGCLKSTVFRPDGSEHILNFHLVGEVLGLAGIYQQRHAGNAIAVEPTTVCYLSFREILRLAQTFPELVLGLLRIASRSALYTGRLTGDHNAVVRIAAFLLSMSGRLRAQGQSATEFRLVMSREDIANHLRLAPETVSRVLSQMNADGVIVVNRRSVKLMDAQRLQDLAEPMLPYA
ncbi:MAG: helix-turn-helix domain-containing protein [Gammaproteobacteria bacterium]